MSQDRGEYVGDIQELKGMTALLRLSGVEGKIQVRFDETIDHPVTGQRLDIYWHEFNTKDFKILVQVEW